MSVDNPKGIIPSATLSTEFNDFGKVSRIEDGNTLQSLTVDYGPDFQRWSSELSRNGSLKSTRLYFDDYEKTTDSEGEQVYSATYDVWGKQAITQNAIGLYRGYCGHEMLNDFNVINMNGRLYDPVLGRFFSPDNYVQMPENSQSFNRYSYCLNNPLKYTDPSGEFWNLIIGGVIGGVFNWASHGFQFNAKGLGYFFVGSVAGSVTAGVASGVNVAVAGGNFWAGAAGMANGISSTGFFAGAITGASSGFAGGLLSGFGNSLVDGHSIGNSLKCGLALGGVSALMSGFTAGVLGGFDAMDNHTNFWTGFGNFDTTGAMACQGCEPKSFNIGKKIRAKLVGRFEGQRVFESKMLGSLESDEYAAFTLPDIGIFAGDGVFTSSKIGGIVMMQHEFGHVLQYRKVGADFYYNVIAKESLMNCNKVWPYNGIPHDEFWTETWANYLSKHYFGDRWLGMETLFQKHENLYYPSKNISKSFLMRKLCLPF